MARWYLTPQKLYYMHPLSSSLCWKGCQALANYTHCWWDCPVIQVFLKKIPQQFFFIITEYRQPFKIMAMILDVFPDEPIPLGTCDLISTLCAAAHFVIAKYWNSPDPLPVKLWYDKLFEFFPMDKSATISTSLNPD